MGAGWPCGEDSPPEILPSLSLYKKEKDIFQFASLPVFFCFF